MPKTIHGRTGGDTLVYLKIFHGINWTIHKYYTYEYFTDEESMNRWIEDTFNPLLYNPDLCYIVETGKADIINGKLVTL